MILKISSVFLECFCAKLYSVSSLTSVEIFQIYTQQMWDENLAEYVNTSGKRNIWTWSWSIRSFSQCPRKWGNTSSRQPQTAKILQKMMEYLFLGENDYAVAVVQSTYFIIQICIFTFKEIKGACENWCALSYRGTDCCFGWLQI